MSRPNERPAPDDLRASDAEREQIVEQLGRHVADGRLTIAEFDTRAADVYRSVTRAQARETLRDLPELPGPPAASAPTPASPHRRWRLLRLPVHQRIEWSAWLAVGSINVVIWGIVSLVAGGGVYPWPIWVIGPWGAVLALRTLTGWEGGCDGADRTAHHQRVKELRRQARRISERPPFAAHAYAPRQRYHR